MARSFPLAIVMVAVVAACSPTTYTHGIPNFAKVDDGLYRSGQITTAEGWAYLRSVVGPDARIHVLKLNADNEGSDALAHTVGADVRSIVLEPIDDVDVFDAAINAFRITNLADVRDAAALLTLATPVDVWLVHCTHGQDRTGIVIGVYRVMHDGWTKQRAYDEMRAHNFHAALHGVHEAWERFSP
jgi:hypothetical protein